MSTTVSRAARALRRIVLTAGALTIVAGATLATAGPTSAVEVEREKHGVCTNNSRWELQLERENGRIEIDLEVDTPKAGKTWTVKLRHDGVLFTKVTRVTDAEGEFEVDRLRNDHPGEDKIFFKAVNQGSGEACKGSLRI
jgi:hypothetical protein